jgi:hypothetical protein
VDHESACRPRNGRTPGVGRALLRILIPIASIESSGSALGRVAPDGEWGLINSLLIIGLAIACPWVVALLWLTARRGNGIATAWDLATGTRVVVRPRGARRPRVEHRSRTPTPNQGRDAAGGPEPPRASVRSA